MTECPHCGRMLNQIDGTFFCYDCDCVVTLSDGKKKTTPFVKTNCENLSDDNVNHPKHYTSADVHCSVCSAPIECIDVTRNFDFNIGNALKYLWRYKHKNGTEDLEKAIWYIKDEIKKLS